MTKETMEDQIENLIDENSLHAVIRALAQVCRVKADHLESNWQDKHGARTWNKAALYIDQASAKVFTLPL